MKFTTAIDASKFCSDIGRVDLVGSVDEKFVPDDKMVELFLVRRTELVRKLKDFSRSQDTKAAWRRGRSKFMQGIQRFAKSNVGRRFHRELGRFLATRVTRDKIWVSRAEQERDDRLQTNRDEACRHELSIYESGGILKALSSIKTHAYVMLEYYQPVEEEVELWLFLEEFLPVISSVEAKVLEERGQEVSEEELDLLLRIADPATLIVRFVEAAGCLTLKQIEELWGKEKGADPANGKWGLVTGRYYDLWSVAQTEIVKQMVGPEYPGFFLKVAEHYASLLQHDKRQDVALKPVERKPRRLEPIPALPTHAR